MLTDEELPLITATHLKLLAKQYKIKPVPKEKRRLVTLILEHPSFHADCANFNAELTDLQKVLF
jgi:hypothetical protein